MRGLNILTIMICTIASGCQTTSPSIDSSSSPVKISDSAASAIAGDLAGRFVEQNGEADVRSIEMAKGSGKYAAALEAALRGWGYSVVAKKDQHDQETPTRLAYTIDKIDGMVLASISTPSIGLSRAYDVDAVSATPRSPLSIVRGD
ncbi:conjugal transfer protein TrbH [Rhizobium cauense]|uniref:conjugal transfer protein TrbH n=1 Tax=Rhizobium cauense TaxID=1166683 RepID=UPI001C6E68DD|nr:conjugal transfer protein TrbH [Rhizobium cauense]MBW9118374.1 conjugal transfer protein TrbH [Rhizobium cauense]